MKHVFDTDLAEKYGIDGAVIMEHLYFWITKNKANRRHYFHDRYWTYNTLHAWAELFPYLAPYKIPDDGGEPVRRLDIIHRVLNRLERSGAILKGRFNKTSYDRTTWYSLSDKSFLLFDNIHIAKSQNGISEIATAIPDTKPNNKTDKKEKDTIVSQKKSEGWFKKVSVDEFEAYQKADGKLKGNTNTNIWMKMEEYNKLNERYGKSITERALQILNLQKDGKPEKQQLYLSDYSACIKWAITSATKQLRDEGKYHLIKEGNQDYNPDYNKGKDKNNIKSADKKKLETFTGADGIEYYKETGYRVPKSLHLRDNW